MFRSDLDKQLQLQAAAASQRREQEIKEAEERAHQHRLEQIRSSATNPRATARSFRNPFSPSTPAGFLPPSSSTSFVTNSFPAQRSVSFGDNFTPGPPAAPHAGFDSARIEALIDQRLKAYGHQAAPSALHLATAPSALNLGATPSALSRGIATSLEMQRAATSLEGRRAAVRSFDSSGRQCCMYCGRLACSTSCPLQQCPLGDRSGDGFTRCRGTTLKGERCKVTSESPRQCGSAPLQLGGQYCEKHSQTATIAPVELIPSLNPFTATLMKQTLQLMRIGGMSEDEFNEWSNE